MNTAIYILQSGQQTANYAHPLGAVAGILGVAVVEMDATMFYQGCISASVIQVIAVTVA